MEPRLCLSEVKLKAWTKCGLTSLDLSPRPAMGCLASCIPLRLLASESKASSDKLIAKGCQVHRLMSRVMHHKDDRICFLLSGTVSSEVMIT